MGVPDDNQEFWYHLFAVSAFFMIPTTVLNLAKMSNVFDKRARICNHPLAVLPGIVFVAGFALLYLGLMIPATFLHVSEPHSGDDNWYDEVNWIIFVVAVLMALFPHIYTIDYYSSWSWRKYTFSSWPILVSVSNLLYSFMMVAAFVLMILVCVFTGLDGRVVPVILYSIFTFVLLCTMIYFLSEWRWCAGEFNRISIKGNVTIIKVVEILENRANSDERRDTTIMFSTGGNPGKMMLPM